MPACPCLLLLLLQSALSCCHSLLVLFLTARLDQPSFLLSVPTLPSYPIPLHLPPRPSQPSSSTSYIISSNPLPIRVVFGPCPFPLLPSLFSPAHSPHLSTVQFQKSALTLPPCPRRRQRRRQPTTTRRHQQQAFNWFLAPGACDSSARQPNGSHHSGLDPPSPDLDGLELDPNSSRRRLQPASLLRSASRICVYLGLPRQATPGRLSHSSAATPFSTQDTNT